MSEDFKIGCFAQYIWPRKTLGRIWDVESILLFFCHFYKKKMLFRDKLYHYKSHLIIHTVVRICPSSIFSVHTLSFSQLNFWISPFVRINVAAHFGGPLSLFLPLIQCRPRITLVADKNVIFLFVITISFFFMFSCSNEICNDSLTLNSP